MPNRKLYNYAFLGHAQQQMLKKLESNGVPYFDFSKAVDFNSPTYSIEGDGHPMPATHKTIAEFLVDALHDAIH